MLGDNIIIYFEYFGEYFVRNNGIMVYFVVLILNLEKWYGICTLIMKAELENDTNICSLMLTMVKKR